jgi:murein DD-endopeptidase MepM/ murein hydrolase activator NlpD
MAARVVLANIPLMRALAGRTRSLRSIVLAVFIIALVTAGVVSVPADPGWAAEDDACGTGGGDPADEKKLKAAQAERQAIQKELNRVLDTGQVLEAEIEIAAEERKELAKQRDAYDKEAGAATDEIVSHARRSYMLTNSDPMLSMLSATDIDDVVEQSRMLGLLARGSRVDLEHASSAEQRTTAAAEAAQRAAEHLDEVEGQYEKIEREKKELLAKAKETESRLSAKIATQRAANGSACPLPPGQVAGGLACPVDQPRSYSDTWGAPRSGGRSHMGVDILAPTGTPLRAYEAGTITRLNNSSLGGISIYMTGNSGNQYYYTHLSRYVSRVSAGDKVAAGTHIGFVGDSGNAAGIPHLHWEVRPGGGANVNPYPFARQACG